MDEAGGTGEVRVVKMPKQKPGRSKQDYSTPSDFMSAVRQRFGPIVCDLAASHCNAQSDSFYDLDRNSLTVPWAIEHPEGALWLNPPFSSIAPWASKCRTESVDRRGHILLLVPASIGSNWFQEHVFGHSIVLALSPRLTFGGCEQPYPKDCILAVYGLGLRGFYPWRWK